VRIGAAFLSFALAACSGTDPGPRSPGSARTRQGLDELAQWLHDSLTSGDPARISAVLLSDAEIDAGYDAPTRLVLSEQLRSERRHVGATAEQWGHFSGSTYRGFCARGAAVLEEGERGAIRPTEVVDELLVVGHHSGRDWAGWLREVVSTSEGFRLMKLPADVPRSGHPELDLWSCEVARRPGDRLPGRP
jgi:hypothetical protein